MLIDIDVIEKQNEMVDKHSKDVKIMNRYQVKDFRRINEQNELNNLVWITFTRLL